MAIPRDAVTHRLNWRTLSVLPVDLEATAAELDWRLEVVTAVAAIFEDVLADGVVEGAVPEDLLVVP